jgi:hypothetical protein
MIVTNLAVMNQKGGEANRVRNYLQNAYYIDSCAVHSAATRSSKKLLEILENGGLKNGLKLAITSFNLAELDPVTREKLKKSNNLVLVEIPVERGDWEFQRTYMRSTDANLESLFSKDFSDGVLAATAIKTQSKGIVSSDQHLINGEVYTYMQKYRISVYGLGSFCRNVI